MNVIPSNKQALSIVVPTLNEAENVHHLVVRIHIAMQRAHIPYEIIFIDDHSTDDTKQAIQSLQSQYPGITVHSKAGKPGKAFSLLEGFAKAKHPYIAMIDADLQYPPESITAMHSLLETGDYDVVVTQRRKQKTSLLRQVMTRGFNFVFTRLLFGIKYDSQSGLKLFKKHVLRSLQLNPSPWSFDLEFIVRALENGHTVASHPIQFASRTAGEPKVHVVSTAIELAKASIGLWFRSSRSKVKSGYLASTNLSQNSVGVVMQSVLAAIVIGGLLSASPVQAMGNTTVASERSVMRSISANQPLLTVPAGLIDDSLELDIPVTVAPADMVAPDTASDMAHNSALSPVTEPINESTDIVPTIVAPLPQSNHMMDTASAASPSTPSPNVTAPAQPATISNSDTAPMSHTQPMNSSNLQSTPGLSVLGASISPAESTAMTRFPAWAPTRSNLFATTGLAVKTADVYGVVALGSLLVGLALATIALIKARRSRLITPSVTSSSIAPSSVSFTGGKK